MNDSITAVTLIVKNQPEALEFYTKKVGFEKKIDFPTPGGHRWVTVGPQGQDMSLALWQAEWTDFQGKTWTAGDRPPIVLSVDDCRRKHAELKARGVEFEIEVTESPYGTIAFFSDPDGNLFEILSPRRTQRSQ